MNKQELATKWSKYCNTNKLVDDTMELLTQYGHRNSEHGVCTLLDTYFTNKEPLIKLFMTSKHYIGDMRIAINKEFERNVNARQVQNYLIVCKANLRLEELYHLADEDGKTFFDHLMTGKKVFGVDELPNASQQQAKIAEMHKWDYDTYATVESVQKRRAFDRYFDFFYKHPYSELQTDFAFDPANNAPELKAGTKTSRAFNKVCHFYGVDKLHPAVTTVNGVEKTVYPYNKIFAEYSDLVTPLIKEMPFVISLNPLDYLTMSNGVNWVSCHNIRSGSYMGGTLSYMLDAVSIITFVVEKIDGDIHKTPKVYRQMYHYEKNLFIQSRLYPKENDGATNLYEQFKKYVIEEFDDLLEAGGEWNTEVGPSACCRHAQKVNNSKHYPDYTYNANASIFYPTNNAPSVRNHIMTIGHTGICVNCGKQYSQGNSLNHLYIENCNR